MIIRLLLLYQGRRLCHIYCVELAPPGLLGVLGRSCSGHHGIASDQPEYVEYRFAAHVCWVVVAAKAGGIGLVANAVVLALSPVIMPLVVLM